MKKNSIWILCMILLFTFTAAGCSKANNEVEDGNKSIEENAEKVVWYKGYYNQKRDEYAGDDAAYFKGYEFYSAGTNHEKRIIYNAVDDGSVINGYAADIQLFALEKGTPKEEDCLKFAEVEFMQYMDSGAPNIVQMSCIIKTSDKKKHTFVLRFANEERTRVVQYIGDGKDGEYKEVDNSYIGETEKADTPRYFYDTVGNTDCLLKDMESGGILSLNVDVSELVFGKNVDAGYACDIIMEKADEGHKEADEADYVCNGGIVFPIQTNGKNSATVAVIYDEKGYKIFKFNDAVSDMPDSERIDGKYVDREALEKELGEIL